MRDLMAVAPRDRADEERGFVLGAALLEGRVLADRLLGEARGRCAEALASIEALDRAARARVLADVTRTGRTPLPAGAEHAHPSWWNDRITGVPEELVLALVDGLPPALGAAARATRTTEDEEHQPPTAAVMAPEVLDDVRRWVFGDLVPMPVVIEDGVLGGSRSLDEHLERVRRRGADVLGMSLAGAPAEILARAMAQVGTPWAAWVRAAARAFWQPTARGEARTSVAMASARATSGWGDDPRDRLALVGAVVLGRAWRDRADNEIRALAQRLPRALGRVLIDAAQGAARAGRTDDA